MRPLHLAAGLWLACAASVGGFGVAAHAAPAVVTAHHHHDCDEDECEHHDDDRRDRTVTEDHWRTETHYETRYERQTVTEDRTHDHTVTEERTETVHDGSHSTHCAGLVSACDVATVTVDAQHLLSQSQGR